MTHFKKLLALLLAAVMLFSLLPVTAAENTALAVNVASTAAPGEALTLTVSLPDGTDAVGGSFELTYDPVAVELATATAGTILKNCSVNLNSTYASDRIRLTFDGEDTLPGGILLTAVFRVRQDASGTVAFAAEKCKLMDAAYNAIEIAEAATAATYIFNNAETTVSLRSTSAAQSGDTVEVFVDIADPRNVYGGSFNLVYDAEKLTLSSASAGSAIAGASRQINKTYAENKVRVTWAGAAAISGDGTLMKLVFTVSTGVSGDASFSLDNLMLGDLNGAAVACVVGDAVQTAITCNHDHMEWVVTTPATCTEAGVESYACDCGYATETRPIAALGHEMGWVVTTEATCTEAGVKTYQCLHGCGYAEDTEGIPAHDHSYREEVTAPTQSERGYTTYLCTACGDSYQDNFTDALGYTVTYSANGGEDAPESQHKQPGESVTITAAQPTREGFTFLGWAPTANAEAATVFGGDTYAEDADLTLFAVWSGDQHTVTYRVDGAQYAVQTYEVGALISAPDEPTREGSIFSGWSNLPITMPNEDVEVVGTFVVCRNTLFFETDGGSAMDPIEANYGATVTVPSDPTKDNATFVGWSTTAGRKKAAYFSGDKLTLTGDTTLYAIWSETWTGNASTSLSGAGTKTNPYRVESAADLAFMRDQINAGVEQYQTAYYIQTANIALNDTSNLAEWAMTAPANEWTPIKPFKGVYDGNGYVISGLYINQPEEGTYHKALFGFVDGGTIANVGIESGYVNVWRYSGALVGGSYGATIKNCYNKATVVGTGNVSGIIGAAETRHGEIVIDNCRNEGDIQTTDYSGGIVGGVTINEYSLTICNCKNNGNVAGNNNISGIIGAIHNESETTTQIQGCTNSGEIIGISNVGGIAGYYYNGSIRDCSNTGAIISSGYAGGGIVGRTKDAVSISGCWNGGPVSATGTEYTAIGGIAGYVCNSSIGRCYNYGTITTNGYEAAGIVAVMDGQSSVKVSYNCGSVTAVRRAAGIAAVDAKDAVNTIHDCENTGKVTASADQAGGIIALSLANTVSKCVNIGTVSAASSAGAIVGYLSGGTTSACYYLDSCGAAGAGTARNFMQMQNAASFAYYSSSQNTSWKETWRMGSNPYAAYPMLRGMDNLMENPLELDLNGGHFEEYTLCASAIPANVNTARITDSLIVYNSSMGSTTGTNEHGTEVLVNDRGIVTAIEENRGNATIPNNGFVLSGNGIMQQWLKDHVAVGDKIVVDYANTNKVSVYKKNPKFVYATGFVDNYLPTPYREGYLFIGWYDEAGNVISTGTVLNSVGNLTLHARWTQPTETARTTYGGNTYVLFDKSTTWQSAKAYCESLGGHLATVTSEDEWSAISALCKNNGIIKSYYIGATDEGTNGTWRWITDEAWNADLAKWSSGNPDNWHGIQEHALIWHVDDTPDWDDVQEAYIYSGFVCEFEGEDLQWSLENGVLRITSVGAMPDYTSSTMPWYDQRESITQVIISDCVSRIGNYAFYDCTNLSSVILNNGLQSIGNNAFGRCTSLTSISIPQSVTSIGNSAFYYTGLTTITIPGSVSNMGNGVFSSCRSLLSAVIENGVTVVSESMFQSCSVLSSVSMPDSIKSIGYGAFRYCTALETITIPKGVTSVDRYAFSSCKNINVDESNTTYSSISGVLVSKDQKKLIVYPGGRTDTSYSTPAGVTAIEEYAFYENNKLERVQICSEVTSIGKYAFSGCSLKSLYIYGPVTEMGTSAFSYNRSLTSVTLSNIKVIGTSAFYKCDVLRGVSIPNSVTSIESGAFQACTYLSAVSLGTGVTSIGSSAFSGCSKLSGITIPDNVIEIGASAFNSCSALKTATIGNGVTSIGASAFCYCRNLESVSLGNGLKTIGNYAFGYCNNLNSVNIPSSVTQIGNYAFDYCSSLESITIPDSVSTLGYGAFYGCESIVEATIGNGVRIIDSYTFQNCSNLSSVSIPSSVYSIGTSAYRYCENLTSITIPDSVTRIDNYAFDCCTKLATAIYAGSQEQWNRVQVGQNNDELLNALHIHDWDDGVFTAEPTCTEPGSKTYTCLRDASHVRTEVLEALGHDMQYTTVDGITTGHCSRCDYTVVTNQITVVYNANGGEGAPEAQMGGADYPLALSETVPSREGSVFLGWATAQDATDAEYQPGETVTPNADLTLYAVWQEQPVPPPAQEFTATYFSNVSTSRWSKWTEQAIADTDEKQVQTKKQYRSRDIVVTASNSTKTLSGWNYDYTASSTGGWIDNGTNWVGAENSDYRLREVSAVWHQNYKTQWQYSRYVNLNLGKAQPYRSHDYTYLEYTGWHDYPLQWEHDVYFADGKYYASYNPYWSQQAINDGLATRDLQWYNEQTRTVEDGGYYTYSYRDTYYTHYFWKWAEGSQWSEWSDIQQSGNNQRSETRTMYRERSVENEIVTTQTGVNVLVTDFIPTGNADAVFLGWSTDENATEAQYVAGDRLTLDADVYLYAVWQEETFWRIDDGVLTISGVDKIDNYSTSSPAPWYDSRAEITAIVIGDGVTEIGNYAFYRLTNVSAVSLPESVTKIGDSAFRYCNGLTDVTLCSDVLYGKSVFANCAGLQTVTVENGISLLPRETFQNCGELATLTLPGSVTLLNDAFAGTEIGTVTYAGTKAAFAALITDTFVFDEVCCTADDATYPYTDFVQTVIPVASITLDQTVLGLACGQTAQLSATVLPQDATDQAVSWSSDNRAAVTVDENGNVTAVAVGVAEITAQIGNVAASCTVYVTPVAETTDATIYVSSVEAKNGDTVEVSVSLQNNPGIVSMRLRIDYNDAMMTLVGVEDADVLGQAYHAADTSAVPYTLYWDNGAATENFTANGEIVRLTFKINEQTVSGEYPIEIRYDYNDADIINCDLSPVKFKTANGNVSIQGFRYGDVNGDGSVNALDSALLARYIGNWPGITIDRNAADVNHDGKVNALDSAILKRHLANWADYATLPH